MKTSQTVLCFKRQAGASFVSGRSFDPFLESRNVLIDYSSRLDRGETIVGLALKSGPFGTAVPALEKRNGHLVLHLLSMSPVPEKNKRASSTSGSMFLSWYITRGVGRPVIPRPTGSTGRY